jgi:hypothetical protein
VQRNFKKGKDLCPGEVGKALRKKLRWTWKDCLNWYQ